MQRPVQLAAALLLSLAACAGATTDPSPLRTGAHTIDVRAGGTVTLAVGETARVDGGQFSVAFRRVVQDSRCPSTVVCIWAGDGAVQLWLKRGWRAAATTLHTLDGPKAAELDGYTVELLELEPYPAASPIDPESYFVTIRITR